MIQFELTTIYISSYTIYVLLASSRYVFSICQKQKWRRFFSICFLCLYSLVFFYRHIKSIHSLVTGKKTANFVCATYRWNHVFICLSGDLNLSINDAICTFSKLFWDGKTFHGFTFYWKEELHWKWVNDDNFVTSWKFYIKIFEWRGKWWKRNVYEQNSCLKIVEEVFKRVSISRVWNIKPIMCIRFVSGYFNSIVFIVCGIRCIVTMNKCKC